MLVKVELPDPIANRMLIALHKYDLYNEDKDVEENLAFMLYAFFCWRVNSHRAFDFITNYKEKE